MCLGIPGQVMGILPDPHLAKVDVSGVKRTVNVGLLETAGLEPGDWVLIHVGFALAKINEDEARQTLKLLEGLGRAYTDEIDALRQSRIL